MSNLVFFKQSLQTAIVCIITQNPPKPTEKPHRKELIRLFSIHVLACTPFVISNMDVIIANTTPCWFRENKHRIILFSAAKKIVKPHISIIRRVELCTESVIFFKIGLLFVILPLSVQYFFCRLKNTIAETI